jgi:adenylate kinase
MIIILLGPPGSGKGTHSELICKHYGLLPIATGDVLRERIKRDDELAKQIKSMMGTGELFPDETMNLLVDEIINHRVDKTEYNGLLFDGYPRTLNQSQFLDLLLTKVGHKIDAVILFKIPDDTIIKRITARRVDRKTGKVYNLIKFPPPSDGDYDLYQRVDDTEDVIKNRLHIYKEEIVPINNYYKEQGILHSVDASDSVEHTQANIDKILSILIP